MAPSRFHRCILALAALCAATATFISPLALPFQLIVEVLIAALFVRQLRATNSIRTLQHFGGPEDTTNQWSFCNRERNTFQGSLQNDGYKSAGLLVLVFQESASAKRVRVPVFFDSVSKPQYSYLTMQLMFNTDIKDEPRMKA